MFLSFIVGFALISSPAIAADGPGLSIEAGVSRSHGNANYRSSDSQYEGGIYQYQVLVGMESSPEFGWAITTTARLSRSLSAIVSATLLAIPVTTSPRIAMGSMSFPLPRAGLQF